MKIALVTVGETHKKWAAEGEEEYMRRIVRYLPFQKIAIPDLKNTRSLNPQQQKEKEGSLILQAVQNGDFIVLLDERGKEMTSNAFASYLQELMNRSFKRVLFIVGGPYGFSPDVYSRADALLSFSRMTFPHDLVRVIFAEQLYRSLSILNGEPYHHE